MKVLLLHPEDSPLAGPWAGQRWDLIVDLGRSSPFTSARWSEQAGCPIVRLDSFRNGVSNARQVKQLFAAGRGLLVDQLGLDWWEIVSLYFVPQTEVVVTLQSVCRDLNTSSELWATRAGWPSSVLASLLNRTVRNFARSANPISARARRYANLVRHFSPAQIQEIFLDKYDPGYRWRARARRRRAPMQSPVVLVPTAYENVSRMAADYARLAPDQQFLFVSTRRRGSLFDAPPNVQLRQLSDYAVSEVSPEAGPLVERWATLQSSLGSSPEYRALRDSAVFADFEPWIIDGLSVRDAWANVLANEPVCSVLCGDDSNSYTRIPMLLGARRGLPTLDFHHGALDGFYLVKDLDCSLYLAKSEMERDYLTRVCGLPSERLALAAPRQPTTEVADRSRANTVVLFSEPYEVSGARCHEVYAELLPPLARLARRQGGRVIVKLHPFESASARSAIIRSVLPAADQALFTVKEGPLTPSLLEQTWCGVTVESSVVLDCTLNHVPCFLCEWLANPVFGYVAQFTRFGVGSPLRSAAEIEQIPELLLRQNADATLQPLLAPATPAEFAHWLASGARDCSPR